MSCELWRIIDEYNKSEDYENRAWEEFESAFNEVSKSLLLPKHKEFDVDMVIADDKQWYITLNVEKMYHLMRI